MGIVVLAWLAPVGLAVKSSGGSSSSGKEIAGTCPLPVDAVSGVSRYDENMASSWCSAQTLLRRSACERSGCVAWVSDRLRRIRQRCMGLRRSG